MATKKKSPSKRADASVRAGPDDLPAVTSRIPPQLVEYLEQTAIPSGFVNPKPIALTELRQRVNELNLRSTVPADTDHGPAGETSIRN